MLWHVQDKVRHALQTACSLPAAGAVASRSIAMKKAFGLFRVVVRGVAR